MTKNKKSLTTGSVLKRTLLIINHYVQIDRSGTGSLTNDEVKSILDSFKTDKEINQYNKYRKMFDNIKAALSNISTFKYAYSDSLQRLDKLLILRQANLEYRFLADRLGLFMEDKGIKENVLDLLKDKNNKVFVNPENHEKAISSLDQTIKSFKNTVNLELVQLKTAIQVYKDYVKETKFNVTIISRMLAEIEDFAINGKGTYIVTNANDLPKLAISRQQLEKLEKNGLIEDYEKTPIDPKKYQSLRKGFFKE